MLISNFSPFYSLTLATMACLLFLEHTRHAPLLFVHFYPDIYLVCSFTSFESLFKRHHRRKTFPVHSKNITLFHLKPTPLFALFFSLYSFTYFFCLRSLAPKKEIFSLFSSLMFVQCIVSGNRKMINHYSLNE